MISISRDFQVSLSRQLTQQLLQKHNPQTTKRMGLAVSVRSYIKLDSSAHRGLQAWQWPLFILHCNKCNRNRKMQQNILPCGGTGTGRTTSWCILLRECSWAFQVRFVSAIHTDSLSLCSLCWMLLLNVKRMYFLPDVFLTEQEKNCVFLPPTLDL